MIVGEGEDKQGEATVLDHAVMNAINSIADKHTEAVTSDLEIGSEITASDYLCTGKTSTICIS